MNQDLITGQSEYCIVYAEDHQLLRQIMCNTINNFSEFKVIAEAENGQQLIDLINNGVAAQLVIIDLNMPVLNGYDTTKWLKKNQPHIKILIDTAFENDTVKAEAIRCGADAVISKSKDLKDIYRALKQLVNEA